MRDIKFRVWDKEKKEMLDICNLRFFITGGLEEVEAYGGEYVFDHNDKRIELMQYTGLKDKNGKEIYEGDILGDCGTYEEIDETHFEMDYFAVEWNDEVCAYTLNGESLDIWDIASMEVVGNIYEDKEKFNFD